MAGPESTDNTCDKQRNGSRDAHYRLLVQALWKQCESRSDLCDVTLVVGDKEVKAHWCVLVSCPYFESVHSSGMSESTSGRVTLIDTTIEAVQAALQHIYLGSDPWDDQKICSGPSEARELMQLADYLQLTLLKEQCAYYLARCMAESFDHAHRSSGNRRICVHNGRSSAHGVPTAGALASAMDSGSDIRCKKDEACGTALELYRLAQMYGTRSLSTAAYREIVRDFEAFASQPEMMAIDSTMLSGFLTDRNLRYVPARVMFDLLQRWIEHDKTARGRHFPQLFCALSLDGVDLDYYDKHIASNPAVLEDAGCIRHSRQHRRTLRGGTNVLGEGMSGSSSRHHRLLSGPSSSLPSASSGSCGDTVDVIVVGGVRLSRLQYAFVIDENRWTSLPTLPPIGEDFLGASEGLTAAGAGPVNNDLAALSRYMASSSLNLIYLEAVVGQRLFALCQELSSSSFSLWELDEEERCWLSRGRLPLPGTAGSNADNVIVPSVLRGYWMTAFSCAGKMCFIYALTPAGSRRCALMLACVDVIALADLSADASSEQPLRRSGSTGQRETSLSSSSAGAGGNESGESRRSSGGGTSKDSVELFFEDGVDIKDFKYCVGGSKLYVALYGLDTQRLEDVGYLVIYDVERRRILDQCKGAPFGDVLYLDRESRVCVQSFGKRFCRVYNSVNKQWKSSRKSVPALPDRGNRSDFFSCIHKGSLYVFGGNQDCISATDPTKYCVTPLKYAPCTSEWERLADMPLEFCVDAEAFSMSLPRSMLRCLVDCEHCRQVHQENVPRRDQRGVADRGVRHDVNGRGRLFGLSSSRDSSVSDYYVDDDLSRSEDYEEDEDEYGVREANEPDCLLM